MVLTVGTGDGRARWSRYRTTLVLCITAIVGMVWVTASPAWAHKDHKAKQEAAERVAVQAAAMPDAATPMAHDPESPEHGAAMATTAKPAEPRTGFMEHLLDWLSRFHPMLVHFPIAFIPAALFTAVVGRKRPAFAVPVRFLVVTAGVTAPFAMLSGWLSGGLSLGADDWLTQSHRWLGTGIGVGALALGSFALKRPDRDRGTAMIAGLSVLTVAILVQGWFGGALVHGVDHLNW